MLVLTHIVACPRNSRCQGSVAEIAAELAAKLKLGLETKPPEEQIAAAKAWLAERRQAMRSFPVG